MKYSRPVNVTAQAPASCGEAGYEQPIPYERTADFPGRTPTAPAPARTDFELSLNVLFPLLGGRSTLSREHLLPVFVSLIVALLLMAVPFPGLHLMMGHKPAPAGINQAWQVFSILGIYIAFLINYYINQMAGQARSGLLQALVSVFTFLLLTSRFWDDWYALFYFVIPAQSLERSSNPFAVIAGDIFGTGLCEEGLKALPLMGLALMSVAFAYLSGRTSGRLSAFFSSVRSHFGLREPLDGIVLGAASGSGFYVYETLVQYVPMVLDKAKHPANGEFDGLVQVLARGIPELTAHSAYSGLFGYFIGLSVLRPATAVYLIPIGWLFAAVLHGAWDATSDLSGSSLIGVPISLVIGVLSYALLAGAIFKAREISPSFARAVHGLVESVGIPSNRGL